MDNFARMIAHHTQPVRSHRGIIQGRMNPTSMYDAQSAVMSRYPSFSRLLASIAGEVTDKDLETIKRSFKVTKKHQTLGATYDDNAFEHVVNIDSVRGTYCMKCGLKFDSEEGAKLHTREEIASMMGVLFAHPEEYVHASDVVLYAVDKVKEAVL